MKQSECNKLADIIAEANRENPGTFSDGAQAELARFCKLLNVKFQSSLWFNRIDQKTKSP